MQPPGGMTAPMKRGKPPDKGSFPIDHFGECKDVHDEYVACLKLNEYDNMSCRFLSKKYLKCRMDNQLMHPEKFERLGFTEKDNEMHPPRPPVEENLHLFLY